VKASSTVPASSCSLAPAHGAADAEVLADDGSRLEGSRLVPDERAAEPAQPPVLEDRDVGQVEVELDEPLQRPLGATAAQQRARLCEQAADGVRRPALVDGEAEERREPGPEVPHRADPRARAAAS